MMKVMTTKTTVMMIASNCPHPELVGDLLLVKTNAGTAVRQPICWLALVAFFWLKRMPVCRHLAE